MYQHSPHRFFYLLIQNSQFSCEFKKKNISACVLFNLYVCLAFAINTLHECQACQTQTKLNSLIKLVSPSRITTSCQLMNIHFFTLWFITSLTVIMFVQFCLCSNWVVCSVPTAVTVSSELTFFFFFFCEEGTPLILKMRAQCIPFL